MKHYIVKVLNLFVEPLVIIFFTICALVARFTPKKIDIGLGPLPLINNIYHKKVFIRYGYSAETFVNQVWHITNDFDVRGDTHWLARVPRIGYRLNFLRFAVCALFRYRCMLIYFDGGVLGLSNTTFLWRVEPFILALANVKTIVLAYGSDVQEMSRSPNLLFKDAMSKDYPLHKKSRHKIAGKIDLWTTYGDHVVGGCEWVDYMHHWDTLMISHFSIDETQWEKTAIASSRGPMRVLHAPNHRAIKGTDHVIRAVESLRDEGFDIELVLAEKCPNSEIRDLMRQCDVVVDQLIIGWYAMFAIEAMAMGKPVICNLRQDLIDLFRVTRLYDENEIIPLVQATPLTIKQTLQTLYTQRAELPDIGGQGRAYVLKHHSIGAVMNILGPIAEKILGAPKSRLSERP